MKIIRNRKWVIFFTCFLLPLSFSVKAQVSLPANDLGLTSINDGVAGPAILYEAFAGNQNSTKLKDNDGNTVPGDNSLHTFMLINHFVTVLKKPALGGFPAFEVLVPVVNVNVQIEGAGIDKSKTGLGDVIVGAGIQWPNKKFLGKTFFHRFLLNAVLPVGTYDNEKVVNIGSHVWSIMPYYAFTIYWDKATKWETSMRFRYMWNSKNTNPFIAMGVDDIQPGQAFWTNYSVSYMAGKNFRFGVAGYFLQQLSDHKIQGHSIPDSKEMTLSVGPAFFYQYKTNMFRLTGAFDVTTHNRWAYEPFINFTYSKIWPKK